MIFIVDDDDGARASLRLLLECEGMEAQEFVCARHFLDTVKTGKGDCLILDVHMPGMSGPELLDIVRRGDGEMLPVIIVSGRLDDAIRARVQGAGVIAIVDKPYSAEAILKPVRAALGRS
jgi:two-component system, LuxR family, response regulator FixJ